MRRLTARTSWRSASWWNWPSSTEHIAILQPNCPEGKAPTFSAYVSPLHSYSLIFSFYLFLFDFFLSLSFICPVSSVSVFFCFQYFPDPFVYFYLIFWFDVIWFHYPFLSLSLSDTHSLSLSLSLFPSPSLDNSFPPKRKEKRIKKRLMVSLVMMYQCAWTVATLETWL